MQTQATAANKSVTPPLCQGPSEASDRQAAEQLIAASRHQAALHVITRLLTEHPGDADLWSLGATAAHAVGQFADAVKFWDTALTINPEHFEALYTMGEALLQRHDLEPATTALLRAAAVKSNDASALVDIALVLAQHRKLPQAITLLRQAHTLTPDDTTIYRHLTDAYLNLNQFAEAQDWANRLTARFPNAIGPMILRAQVLAQSGDLDAAELAISKVLKNDPYNGLAHLLKVENHLRSNSEDARRRLRIAYRHRKSRNVQDQICLNFAVGKSAESAGDIELAFKAYAEGNRLHYAREPWDEAQQEQNLLGMTHSVSTDTYSTAATLRILRPHKPGHRTPVFIVGMPRSGTSLLEQVISSHPEVYGAGELTVLADLLHAARLGALNDATLVPWLDALMSIGEQYMEDTAFLNASSPFICDKMPGNYKIAGLIPLMIPHAKVIHIRRDPMDTCWSCFTTMFAEGHQYSFDQSVLGREYGRYRRWMQHWRTVMPAGTLLEIDYEDLVADLRGSAETVLQHIGLDWNEACLNFHRNSRVVTTASFAQVRQPLYSRSIGRWRPYERHLAPLRQALDETEPQTVN